MTACIPAPAAQGACCVVVPSSLTSDVSASLSSFAGQAEAARLGISRALCDIDAGNRSPLKAEGFLKRDPRAVERKKYGLRKVRRRPLLSRETPARSAGFNSLQRRACSDIESACCCAGPQAPAVLQALSSEALLLWCWWCRSALHAAAGESGAGKMSQRTRRNVQPTRRQQNRGPPFADDPDDDAAVGRAAPPCQSEAKQGK